MNRILVSLILAVSIVGAASGAEPSADRAQLRPMEWLIGDWVAEYTSPIDFGVIKQGEWVVSRVSRHWALDRQALILDAMAESGGRRMAVSHEVSYWDAASSSVSVWGQSAVGPIKGRFTAVGDRCVLNFATEKAGVLTGTGVLEKIDDDSYTWQLRDVALNGEKTAEFPKITYRRKTGVAAGEPWKIFCKVAAGTWSGSGNLTRDFKEVGLARGDKFEATFVFRPEMDGAAMVGHSEFRFPGKAVVWKNRVLANWDPYARQIRSLACWSNGGVEEILLNRREGAAFIGTYAVRNADIALRPAQFRLDYTDPAKTTATFLDGPNKGTVLSTWKRQASGQPAAASSAPPLLKEYAAAFLGTWECKDAVPWGAPAGAAKVSARATCRWALDGAALEWILQIGDGQVRGLTGYDAVSKQLKGFGVGGDGSWSDTFVSKEDDKWILKVALTAKDGQQTNLRAVTTFDPGGDRHVNEYPDHKDVFVRVKK